MLLFKGESSNALLDGENGCGDILRGYLLEEVHVFIWFIDKNET